MQKIGLIVAVMGLAACQPQPTDTPAPGGPRNAIGDLQLGSIVTDDQGRCFAREDPPTQTTIVEEQVQVVPEQRDAAGNVTAPAIFRNVTQPRTVVVGQGTRFETVCPQVYTAAFVETLQRALRVRGEYLGPITGTLDADTTAALATFQRRNGRASDTLDIAIARRLGVIATPIEDLNDR